MTTMDAIVLYKQLGELAGRQDLKLPVSVSFKFIRNAKILEPIVLAFDEARTNAIKQYSEPSPDNPDEVIVSEQNINVINEEIKALGMEPIDIELVPVKLSELEGLDLNMQDLAGIYPIVQNEEA